MGRKKFNNFSKEKKQDISDKINGKINEITSLKKSYEENLDIFDAVNDEMKTLFECDLNCSTCGPDDKGSCMQNFRLANVFLQRQCRHLIHIIDNQIDAFANILEGAGIIIEGLKSAEKSKKEEIEGRDPNYYR